MACFTVIAGVDMAGVLSSRCSAVMAITTTAKDFIVIDLNHWGPVSIRMAAFARVSGANVACVFASCGTTIVTGSTVLGHATVVENSFSPAEIWVVAVRTVVTALYMVCGFSFGN